MAILFFDSALSSLLHLQIEAGLIPRTSAVLRMLPRWANTNRVIRRTSGLYILRKLLFYRFFYTNYKRVNIE